MNLNTRPTRLDRQVAAKAQLKILLASPRGFCAGVDRAIHIVEQALSRYGTPVYVRHEIVHNRAVVERLEAKGAIFVDALGDIPSGGDEKHVIFSAHGVPKSVPISAEHRGLSYIDATCPLVSKVHHEAERQYAAGNQVILIGHAGHPEVDGTIGQLPPDAIMLVEDCQQAQTVTVSDPHKVAYVTQTTLAIDETIDIIAVLKHRFPGIINPRSEDICYATTNRQQGVRAIAPRCELVVVLGSANSSNSNRLVEVAKRSGARDALLLDRVREFDWLRLDNVATLGITAGASAPESLVSDLIEACGRRFDVKIEQIRVTEEDVHFKLPRALVA
jgi:4-hydroxy-3-methylbut-2-enyl diphosphate reductase